MRDLGAPGGASLVKQGRDQSAARSVIKAFFCESGDDWSRDSNYLQLDDVMRESRS